MTKLLYCFESIYSGEDARVSIPYHQQNQQNEVEYYNLLPSTTLTSSSAKQTNGCQNLIHSGNSALTPPPSPPNSDGTQNSDQNKSNNGGQSMFENETSLLVKEPRRPPRACDRTDTMLTSAANSIHNYYNLISFDGNSNDMLHSAPVTPPPPRLPKRRPFLMTSRSQSPPPCFSFNNSSDPKYSLPSINNTITKHSPSPLTIDEDLQHQALENGFTSNFARSRVGIQGGPPSLRRMSTCSHGSVASSSITSTTVFNNNVTNNQSNDRRGNNTHPGLDKGSNCHQTQESLSNYMVSIPPSSSAVPSPDLNHQQLSHVYRGGNSNGHTSHCNGTNNARQQRRFHHQASLTSSQRKGGRRAGGTACRCKTTSKYLLWIYIQVFVWDV